MQKGKIKQKSRDISIPRNITFIPMENHEGKVLQGWFPGAFPKGGNGVPGLGKGYDADNADANSWDRGYFCYK